MAAPLTCCVFLLHLLAQLVLRHSGAAAPPLVIASGLGDRAVVLDHCAAATRAGVRDGMLLRDARHVCPALRVEAVDHARLDATMARSEAALAAHADVLRSLGRGAWLLPLRALGAHYASAQPVAERIRTDVMQAA